MLCELLLATLTFPKFKMLALDLSTSVPAAATVSDAGLLVTLPVSLLTTTVNSATLPAEPLDPAEVTIAAVVGGVE